jgi:NADH:ubiquinone oxidoreductase subunit F (NADH-binding)
MERRLKAETWEAYRQVQHLPHYVVSTRMGGFSEAWTERTLLERNPFALIEGMAIAAYALGGVGKGIIYLSSAYKPLAFRRLGRALQLAQARRYIGRNILAMPFNFDIEIREAMGEDQLSKGNHPLVCGECARALFDFEEKTKYENFKNVEVWPTPFYTNNVETYMNIPLVLSQGADSFASRGTKNGTGTKIFALTGKTRHPCLVEAPLGSTLAELLKIADGETSRLQGELKAFQLGGASGGIFPARLQDAPLEFDSLANIGWKIGSGYVVLMDEKVCIVEMARYSLNQVLSESCDRCHPCGKALKNILSILNRVVKGLGETGDLETLEMIAHRLQSQARCPFGKVAALPVLTSLRYFRSEYESHLKQRCPANFCKDLAKDSERTIKLAA